MIQMGKRASSHGGITKIDRYGWSQIKDSRGSFEMVDKMVVEVDETYQRDADNPKVNEIASQFLWVAFGVLLVGRRPDGSLWCFDGQHRLLAAQKRSDVTEVPCFVFDMKTMGQEAEAFLLANSKRKAVSALAKWKAQVQVGDKATLRANELVEYSGRKVGLANASNIACIGLLRKLCAKDQEHELLKKVWPLLCELCEGEVLANELVDAFVYIESKLVAQGEGVSLTDRKWSCRVKEIGFKDLRTGALEGAAFFSKGGAKSWAQGVLNVLNRRLQEKNYLTLEKRLVQGSGE